MPTHDYADRQPESVANAVTAMKLDPNTSAAGDGDAAPPRDGASETPVIKDTDSDKGAAQSPAPSSTPITGNGPGLPSRTSSRSPVKDEDDGDDEKKSVEIKQEHDTTMEEEKVGGGITVKLEPGQPPKLTRSSSQKVVARPPQLFSHLPDSTAEAQATFELMDTCTYANKYMGYTEHAMECDCAEEWGKQLSLTPVSGGDRLLGDACISRVRLVRNTTMTTRPFGLSLHLFIMSLSCYLPSEPQILNRDRSDFNRTVHRQKPRMRRGLGLYQPRYEDRMHG
jgi:histone-lysine N-methyltransferase SETD2